MGVDFPLSQLKKVKVIVPKSYQTHHGGHFKLLMIFCSAVKEKATNHNMQNRFFRGGWLYGASVPRFILFIT